MWGIVRNISVFGSAGLTFLGIASASQAEVVSKSVSAAHENISEEVTPVHGNGNDLIKDVKELTKFSVSEARHLKLQTQNSIFNPSSSLISQTPEAESLRNYLKIQPLNNSISSSESVNSPGLTFATPSAFGASSGDGFFSASAATAGKARSQVNGSLTVGFGLGDARNAVGLELNFNIGSIKNFGSNGSVDGKLHRLVYSDSNNQVSIAAGWKGFIQYGSEGVSPSSAYGAVTYYSILQPDNEINKMPISFTVGFGGGEFRKGNASTGIFAGVGLQVAPQLSVGTGWSGVGINVGLSYVPIPSIPLTFALTGGDLTDISDGGRVLVLSIGYGFNWVIKI
jgi:hypothetical protein